METKGHLLSNPGLRGHSVGENNILSRYVVAYHPEGGIGWIWHDSFDNYREAAAYVLSEIPADINWQIIDTFNNDKIVAEETDL